MEQDFNFENEFKKPIELFNLNLYNDILDSMLLEVETAYLRIVFLPFKDEFNGIESEIKNFCDEA